MPVAVVEDHAPPNNPTARLRLLVQATVEVIATLRTRIACGQSCDLLVDEEAPAGPLPRAVRMAEDCLIAVQRGSRLHDGDEVDTLCGALGAVKLELYDIIAALRKWGAVTALQSCLELTSALDILRGSVRAHACGPSPSVALHPGTEREIAGAAAMFHVDGGC